MHTVRRAGGRATRYGRVAVRRALDGPFRERGDQPLLLHCCHHKVGTVWFQRVLAAVGSHYGLPFEHVREGRPSPGTRLALQHHTRVDLDQFGSFRGSHMIRDPRDVVVSGYHYHLWTEEVKIVAPDPAYGGVSYREHLRSLDRKAGLLAEIRWASERAIADMAAWDYADPRFVEIRYEDAMADADATFATVFEHYGFTPRATAACVRLAAKYGFEQVTRRQRGEVQDGMHLRSGTIGQWRDVFDDDHRALFNELAGSALIALGYEADDRW